MSRLEAGPAHTGEMAERIRTFDWSTNPLGPLETWPEPLHHALALALPSRLPMCVIWGDDLIQIYNDAYGAVIGPDHHPSLGRSARDVWAEIWPRIGEEIALVMNGRGAVLHTDIEIPITRDGRRQSLSWTYGYSPIPDAASPTGVGGVLVVASETTHSVEARARLEDCQRSHQEILDNLPYLVWRADGAGAWSWASPQWIAYTGLDDAQSAGDCWLEAVHPDDRSRVQAAWREAPARGRLDVEHRLLHAESGGYRWFQTRAKPIGTDADGAGRWVGASSDIDDLHRLQDEQKTLMGELQHRVRNTLAIIRSIARRTGESAESVADFASHFEGRLNAFARTQSRLTRDPTGGVDLEFVVAEELTACAVRESARVRIGGPKIALRSKPAETLTLAIHELATNSVKFGVLSGPGGSVSVTWTRSEASEIPRLEIVWNESGLSIDPDEPRRAGFGSELLLRSLPYELNATVTHKFTRTGLRCVISLPLGRRILA